MEIKSYIRILFRNLNPCKENLSDWLLFKIPCKEVIVYEMCENIIYECYRSG